MSRVRFEWEEKRNRQNQEEYKVSFGLAQYAFADLHRIIAEDVSRPHAEKRYYCFGKAGDRITTVRFFCRKARIRIIGAGYWRKGREIYEKEQR